MKIQKVKPGSIIRYDGYEYIVSNIYHGLNMILVYDTYRRYRDIWGPEEVDVVRELTRDISIDGSSESILLTTNGSILNILDNKEKYVSLRPIIKDLQSVRAGSMIEYKNEKYIVTTVHVGNSVLVYSLSGSNHMIYEEANVKVLRSSNENVLLIPTLDQLPERLVKGQMFSIGKYTYLTIGAIGVPSLLTTNGSILNMQEAKSSWIKEIK